MKVNFITKVSLTLCIIILYHTQSKAYKNTSNFTTYTTTKYSKVYVNPILSPPTIVSLSANNAEKGEIITITGSNFIDDSNTKVVVGNIEVVPTSITSNSISFVVPSAPVNTNIKVRCGNLTSNQKNFTVNQYTAGSLSLTYDPTSFSPYTYKIVATPGSGYNNGSQMEVADFDLDGNQDFLIRKGTTPEGLQILFNDGSGSAANYTNALVNFGTYNVFHYNVTDLDNDGDPDIVASGSNNIVYILSNDGSGNFTTQQISLAGTNGHLIEFTDYDLDGDYDIVCTSNIPATNTGNNIVAQIINNNSGT
ncbi:FG-GAP-like repeat-containing protein [Aestuariibaculum sediminum]|uniref:VCBS repeat-containing protein n=1 Tax=Aestuariibaculum sediminum TaxID=2770637 RepID=A0A8J6QH70_9FLAO|nr:FG-GAP-like repeat-containing protein [Aestuariibaculum sediminum]MBD0831714.1 VCBS repeat-containing protein [Aestuariibaculum sediminum]